jgi:hypothetical protein
MLLAAASNSGGQSTLDTLITLFILALAIAGAAVMLSWAERRLKRQERRPPSTTARPAPAMVRWLRAKAARDRILGRFIPAPEPTVPDAPSPARDPGSPSIGAAAVQADPASAPPTNAPEQAASTPEASATIAPPANPGARYSPEMLEPLGQHLDNSRRLAVVEERLAPVVGALPSDRWLVERYVVVAGRRIPFLILGETGMFVMWALGGQPRWDDVPVLGGVAEDVKSVFPGYTGIVHAGVCRPYAPDVEPRWWCRSGEPGVWVLGLNWVIPWLEHFGPEHGLGVKDVARLRELAGPRWGRGVTDLPPSALVPDMGSHVIPG